MTMTWFTSQELADLTLPGLPGTKRNINQMATREGWQFRDRKGRGGGREYHLTSLPEIARIELARRSMPESFSDTRGGDLDAPQGGPRRGASPIPAGGRSSTRGAARAHIVNLAASFAEASGIAMRVARPAFVTLFNRGEIPVEDWVKAEIQQLSIRSLERWSGQSARDGAARLSGRYGNRKGKGAIEGDTPLHDFCLAQLAARPKLTASQLGAAIAARFGKVIPRRTVQRFIARVRDERADMLLAAADPDAFKNKRQVAFGSRSQSVTGLNQVWEIDATPADVMTTDGRRNTIVGLIDVFSRRAKVLVTDTPKSTATTLLIRRAIMDWGVPESIKTDNGKDFVSAHVVRALSALDIRQDVCLPFTPEGKPHVERFFGTMARDLFAILPGFVGHNVADRKAIEARRTFATRLGESDRIVDVDLSAAELQSQCDRWIDTIYHRRPHAGLGTTPLLKAAEWPERVTTIDDERVLDVMLMEAPDTEGARTVTKKGLRVENALFIAPELGAHVGARVHVRLDPADMGRVVVYDEDGAFICMAECPARTGLDRREVAIQAKAIQKSRHRDLRQEMKRLKAQAKPHRIADEILAHRESIRDVLVAFPRPSAAAHETDAMRAAAQALDALDGKRPHRPITDEDRELAAEALAGATYHENNIVQLASPDEAAPKFANDFEFYDWAATHPDELTPLQLEYFDELTANTTFQLERRIARQAEDAAG